MTLEVVDMSRGLRSALFIHLRLLTVEELQGFRSLLEKYPPDSGSSGVPRRRRKRALYLEVAAQMIRDYSEERAVQLAVELLHQVDRDDLSKQLMQVSQRGLEQKQQENKARADHRKVHQENILKKVRELEGKASCNQPGAKHTKRYTDLEIVQPTHNYVMDHEMISCARRHQEITSARAAHSNLEVAKLFEPDTPRGGPRILVLQGVAGIGKTTTALRILQDWASGELFQDRFDYAFYVGCRGVTPGQHTIGDLLVRSYLEVFKPENDPSVDFKKLIFIIDDLDELPQEECDSKTLVGNKSLNLLKKRLVSNSYILITTRPTASEKLRTFAWPQRLVEMLGFSEDDRKEYFKTFFGNETIGVEVFNYAERTEILYTLCFIPVVCWIVCRAAQEQMESGGHLTNACGTSAGVYVLFLSSMLKPQSRASGQDINLRGLCALAKEGTFQKKVLFDAEDLRRHGFVSSDSLAFLLRSGLLVETTACHMYSFIHLSVQEFLSALFYLQICSQGNITHEQAMSPQADLINLLEAYLKQKEGHLGLTVRFLFGLVNRRVLDQMERGLHWKMSSDVKPVLLRWVMDEIGSGLGVDSPDLIDLFYCLHETQDEEFVKSALEHFTHVDVGGFGRQMNTMDFRMLLSYSKNFGRVQKLHISYYPLNVEELRALMPQLQTCSSLRLCACSITPPLCADLNLVLCTNGSLAKLYLDDNELGESGVYQLWEGMKHPDCKLQTLHLDTCSLTGAACADLSSVVSASPSLTELSLTDNPLGDSGVRELCEGLKHPGCSVKKLDLDTCSLTGAACADLSSVVSASPSLTELSLTDNPLGDSGVRELCEGLKHPGCSVKKLELDMNCLTDDCIPDLCAALSQSREMQRLYLCWNSFTDLSVRPLKQLLKSCGNLKDVRLSGNQFSPEGQEELRVLTKEKIEQNWY
ncbi:NACHT, LRR and PYD domains-containing protein 3-like isoform X2 [Lissotriton helveticus]